MKTVYRKLTYMMTSLAVLGGVLFPPGGAANQARAQVAEYLDLAFAEDTSAWDLQPDGEWMRKDGARQDVQELLMKRLSVRSE